jgi:hypothetical protein
LLITIASAAAACVTPSGPFVWAYAVGLSTNPQVTNRITEWQPTSFRDVAGILFFGSALAIVWLIARRGRVTDTPTLAWLGVFFVIGVYAVRGVAWWPLAAVTAIAGRLVTEPDPTREPRPEPALARRLNAAIVVVLVLVGVVLLPIWRPADPGLGTPVAVVSLAPPGITAALRDAVKPGDRILNPQPWGSWFEFALPEASVAIDSRIELFPVAVWDDYERVSNGGAGWQDTLQDWGVTWFVTGGDSSDAQVARLTAAGWTRVYADDDGAILRAPAS